MEIRVLQPGDETIIITYETKRLETSETDENERQFKAWHASWRSESLNHYLPLGWSFGVFRENELIGYFLAQVLLFTGGLTQTMWVEHIAGNDEAIINELKSVATRLSREKHLQKVVYSSDGDRNG